VQRRQLLIPVNAPGCQPQRKGLSRVSMLSFGARNPQSPRQVLPLHSLVTSQQVLGFVLFGELTTRICVTRSNRFAPFGTKAHAFAKTSGYTSNKLHTQQAPFILQEIMKYSRSSGGPRR